MLILRRERRFSLFLMLNFIWRVIVEKNKERITFLKKRLEMYYEAEEKMERMNSMLE